MACRVQVYSHSGVANYASDSFMTLKQPYIAREVIEAGAEPVSTTSKLTEVNSTKLLHVQIEPGKTVAIELNPQTRHTKADTDSPRYTGNVIFEATVGCTLSIVDVDELMQAEVRAKNASFVEAYKGQGNE